MTKLYFPITDNTSIAKRRKDQCRRGFALLLTLSLMAFLVVLLLSLVTLIHVEMLSTSTAQKTNSARENATLALNIALGQLQQYAGPDQRVTARADINRLNTGNPKWIGIWDSTPTDPDLPPTHATAPGSIDPIVWLINRNDTATELSPMDPAVTDPDKGNNNVWLLETALGRELAPQDQIKLEVTPIFNQQTSKQTGAYAYWIDDESTKAPITVVNENPSPAAGTLEQKQQLTTAPKVGSELINGLTETFLITLAPDTDEIASDIRNSLKRIQNFDELSLIPNELTPIVEQDLVDRFGDISLYQSMGVLANTMRGGLKRDLTRGLDPTINADSYPIMKGEIGSGVAVFELPPPGPVGQTSGQHTFTKNSEPPAPTWDKVRSYNAIRANLDNTIDPVFAPLTGSIPSSSKHALMPIIAMVEMGYGIDIFSSNYQYALHPKVVLINPYNVTLNSADYSVLFDPLSSAAPNASFSIKAGNVVPTINTTIDNFSFKNALGSADLALNITDSFEPGEVKVYSLPNDISLDSSSGGVISLAPGLTSAAVLIDTGKPIDPLLVAATSTAKIELNSVSATHPTLSIAGGHSNAGAFPNASTITSYMEVESKRMNISHNENGDKISRPFGRLRKLLSGQFDTPSTRDLIYFRYSLNNATNDHLTSGNQPGTQNHLVPAGHYARRSDGGTVGDKSGVRMLIDNNPRAILSQRIGGWDNVATYHFDAFRSGEYAFPIAGDLMHGFWGGSNEDDGNGTSTVILFDVLREDEELLSIGQLGHVNWGVDGKHPTYPLGNSYASIFYNANTPDYGYALNEAIWDQYFFSTLPTENLANRPVSLPNSRLSYYDSNESNDLSTLEGDSAYELAASRLMVNGVFNVNSTSVEAWTAFLGSIPSASYEHEQPIGGSETASDSRPYLRLRNLHNGDPASSPNNLYEWSGYRSLNDEQIRKIATAVVDGIKDRSRPARSLAEFINRDLSFPSNDIRNQKGILQAAIDKVVNQDDPSIESDGKDALSNLTGLDQSLIVDSGLINADNPDAAAGRLRTTGAPGFLLQNDLLTPLAPTMSARSDTFYIRAYGDYRNPVTGEVEARVWCEAYAQRLPDYVGSETPETQTEDITSDSPSHTFGRRFIITHFRWLSPEEV